MRQQVFTALPKTYVIIVVVANVVRDVHDGVDTDEDEGKKCER